MNISKIMAQPTSIATFMNLHKRLTIRYILALSLIALVLCSSYTILVRQIDNNSTDAYIINISGMQRMLSQRIAFLALEIQTSRSTEQAAPLAQELQKTLERMISNHAILSTGHLSNGEYVPQSNTVQKLYFDRGGLDEQVLRYASTARQLLDAFYEGGLPAVQESDLPARISDMARHGILEQLNEMVFQYQYEYEDKIERFKQLETLFFLAGLFLLVIEILFIFRPMIGLIDRTVDNLQRSNAELTEFAYRLSHDMRAPIVSAIGLMSALRHGIAQHDTEKTETSLSFIEKELARLKKVIEDVVTLTRNKQSESPAEAIDIAQLLDELTHKANRMDNAVRVTYETDVKRPLIAQYDVVYTLFDNLLSNGVKYADKQKDSPFVHTKAEQISATKMRFTIEDNGLGFPEKYHHNVFSMFKRYHPRVSHGSGLGLYLIQQNVRLLGGTIRFEPLADGSRFVLTLPARYEV